MQTIPPNSAWATGQIIDRLVETVKSQNFPTRELDERTR